MKLYDITNAFTVLSEQCDVCFPNKSINVLQKNEFFLIVKQMVLHPFLLSLGIFLNVQPAKINL